MLGSLAGHWHLPAPRGQAEFSLWLGYGHRSPGWASAIENTCCFLDSGYWAQSTPQCLLRTWSALSSPPSWCSCAGSWRVGAQVLKTRRDVWVDIWWRKPRSEDGKSSKLPEHSATWSLPSPAPCCFQAGSLHLQCSAHNRNSEHFDWTDFQIQRPKAFDEAAVTPVG